MIVDIDISIEKGFAHECLLVVKCFLNGMAE